LRPWRHRCRRLRHRWQTAATASVLRRRRRHARQQCSA
jgi:hypothetical protein